MKLTKIKPIAALAAASALAVALAGCSSGASGIGDNTGGGSGDTGSKELKTVNVGIVQLSIFAPVYVADAKGYFKDEGIKVNLQKVKSGQDAIPLASSGKLDVVAAGISAGMFSAVNAGLDIKVVASMGVSGDANEEPASALIVSKKLVDEGKVKTVADLKGMKIGASGGSGATSAFYTTMALEEQGLGVKDVNWVNLSNPDIPTAIKNGSVAAGFVSSPFWSNAVKDGYAEKLWQTPKGTSGTAIIYGGQFAKSDLAQPFFNALVKASHDLQGQNRYSEENLKIIGDATGQTPEQVKSVPMYEWLPNLAPLPDQLSAMERVWMTSGAITYAKPLPTKKYVDSSFSDKASQ